MRFPILTQSGQPARYIMPAHPSVSGPNSSRNGKFDITGLCTFLKRAHPAKTAENVAAATGVPASTVDKWLRGETMPSATGFAALAAAYGPAVIAASVPGAAWAHERARDEAINAHISAIMHLIGRRG